MCYNTFSSKVKANKARLIRQDKDLRPVYADIDKGKYDITSCPYCGYSALDKNFSTIAPPQAKLIKEQISRSFRSFTRYFVISYDEALERYRLAIANCIVKKGKASEKAFLCLKMAWTIRGYIEEYEKNGLDNTEKVQELKNDEEELIGNAVEGFRVAVAALTQRRAVGFHGEIQAAVGVVVDAVLLQEVDAALGELQPVFPNAVDVAQVRIGPAAAALHPDALVGGINLSGAVKTGGDTAILLVPAVFQPEVGHTRQLVANPLAFRQKLFAIHFYIPPEIRRYKYIISLCENDFNDYLRKKKSFLLLPPPGKW